MSDPNILGDYCDKNLESNELCLNRASMRNPLKNMYGRIY